MPALSVMPRCTRHISALLLAVLALPGPACNRQQPRKPVYPAHGRVLLDGEPTPHALVILHPVGSEDKNAVRVRGEVKSDGTFTLSTYEPGDGAPAGEYVATVEWWLSSAWPDPAEADDAPPTNRLPSHYGQVATSGLRVRINEGTNELPSFNLTR